MNDDLFDALEQVDRQIEAERQQQQQQSQAPVPQSAQPARAEAPSSTQSTLSAFVTTGGKDVDKRSGLALQRRAMTSGQVDRLADEYCYVPLERVLQSQAASSMYHGRDTFTIAVLAARSLPKMARGKAGAKFVVWKLVDLSDASLKAPTSLFLFGEAYSAWWKESEGSVFCVVNPRPVGDDSSADGALKVEVADQLQLIGSSADFATCTAVRRDGLPCSMFVNAAKSRVCHYHVGSAIRPQLKAQAKRTKADMIDRATVSAQLAATAASQPVALGPATGTAERLRTLREQQLALQAKLDAPVVLRPNELAALVPTVHKTAASNTAQLITLSGSMLLDKTRGAAQSISRMTVPLAFVATPAAASSSTVLLPHDAKKALSQLSAPVPSNLTATTDSKKRSAMMLEAARAKAATARERAALAPPPTVPTAPTPASAAATAAVQTARLEQVAAKLKTARTATAATQQLRGDRLSVDALRTADAKGVPTRLPSSVVAAAQRLAKQRPTQNAGLPMLNRAASSTANTGDDEAATSAMPPPPLLSEEERERLRKATSMHEAAAGATTARQDALLDSLREREHAAEVAGSVREMTVTAHHCATCDRTTTVPQTLCSSAGHKVSKLHDVRKRFFRCARCNEPTISLNSLMPKLACLKCSGEAFRAVTLAEFRGQTTVVQSLLPTFRLNHDTPDELLSGNARKRRWQDTEADDRAVAEDRN